MFCPKCGANNADGTNFCASCGAALHTAEETENNTAGAENNYNVTGTTAGQVSSQEPVTQDQSSNKNFNKDAVKSTAGNLWQKVKTFAAGLWLKVKPAVAPLVEKVKPHLKNKYVLAGIGGGAALLIVLCIVLAVVNSGNGYIVYDHHHNAYVLDDAVHVSYDDDMIQTNIDATIITEQASSLDGNITAFITDNDELAVIKGKKVSVISDEAKGFIMSVNGDGILYVTEEDRHPILNLYSVKSGKSKVIEEDCVRLRSFAISPDGKTVAYAMFDEDDEFVLKYFDGSESVNVTSNECKVVGMSNGGKYIYVVGEKEDGDVLYSYKSNGDKETLGDIDKRAVYFNADHTQIMFYFEGKTYISTKAAEAEKISSYKVNLLVAPNANSQTTLSCTTHPVKSLYDHVYIGMDNKDNRSAWYIHKNPDKSSKLVSNISRPSLDQSAEYLYYCSDDELRVIKISDGDNASEKFTTIAEGVDNYVVTSNRKRVYFVSGDSLYSCSGKDGSGKQSVAGEDVELNIVINRKDVVFYNIDGNVYATSNGKKGTKVASDVLGMMNSPNGIVYAAGNDVIYVSSGSKKLSTLWEEK